MSIDSVQRVFEKIVAHNEFKLNSSQPVRSIIGSNESPKQRSFPQLLNLYANNVYIFYNYAAKYTALQFELGKYLYARFS